MKYTKLDFVKVHKDGEKYLSGQEFLRRAKVLTKGTMNQEAFDFYKQKENWSLMPDKGDYVFFVDTEFESGVRQCVRYLYRGGALWHGRSRWLSRNFRGYCGAAVSQVGLSISDTQNFLDPLSFELEKAIELVKKEGYKVIKEF